MKIKNNEIIFMKLDTFVYKSAFFKKNFLIVYKNNECYANRLKKIYY